MKTPRRKKLALRQAPSDCPDAVALERTAYVVDLYDADPPLSWSLFSRKTV